MEERGEEMRKRETEYGRRWERNGWRRGDQRGKRNNKR